MKKNIFLTYCYSFLTTFLLFRSCDTLYYLDKGVSSSKYILFVVVTYLIYLIFEIPLGILADKFSKKKMLFISNLLLLTSILLFIITNNYWTLMLGIIFSALQTTFSTGIGNFIIYNSISDKQQFNKYLFYKSVFTWSSYSIAMILGGYVATTNLVSMYYISLIPIILNFIIILLIDEKKYIKIDSEKTIKEKEILKDAFKNIKNNFQTIMLIFLSYSIINSSVTIIAESNPQYSSELGISTFIIGLYTALMCLFIIFGEFISSKVKNKLYYLKLLPLLVGIDILLIGLLNNKIGIFFILISQLLYAFNSNKSLSILHNSISNKSRITVESILQVVYSIFGITIGIITSIIMKYNSISNTYIILGIILTIYSLFLLLFNDKKDSYKNNLSS